VHQVGNQYIV